MNNNYSIDVHNRIIKNKDRNKRSYILIFTEKDYHSIVFHQECIFPCSLIILLFIFLPLFLILVTPWSFPSRRRYHSRSYLESK